MGAAWSSPYLEKENAELKSKLAEALQQNPELEKLREEHANLTALLQAASEQVETLQSQLAEMEKLREELQAATEEAKQAESLKANLAEMEKLREERANLDSHLQASTEQVETLKTQLAEALQPNPELEKLRKEQHDLNARLQVASEQAKQVETLKAQLVDMEKIREECTNLDSCLKASTEKFEDLQSQLAETEKLRDECTNLNACLRATTVQVETLKAQLVEALQPNPELEKLREERISLNARLLASYEEVKQIETLKAQLAEALQLNPELEKLRKEQNFRLQVTTEHAKQVEILKTQLAEMERIREEHADLNSRLQVANEQAKQVEILKAELVEARKPNPELEKLRKEQHDLMAHLQVATEKAKQVETLKAELAEMEKLRQEHANLVFRLQVATEQAKQVETLQSQLAEARKPDPELEKLREELADKENFDDKARFQAAELAKQVETLKAQLEQVKNTPPPVVNPALQQRVIELESQLLNAEKKNVIANQIVQTLKNQNKHLYEQKISAERDASNLKEVSQQSNIAKTKGNDGGKVKELETEIKTLNQKKDELYELTMSLREKVRTAESRAEEASKESFGKAAEVITKSLHTLNVEIPEAIPKSHEEFNRWAHGLPTALQKITNVAVKSSSSNDNEEVKKLKEDVERYEHTISVLTNQLAAIEAAYAEREDELKTISAI